MKTNKKTVVAAFLIALFSSNFAISSDGAYDAVGKFIQFNSVENYAAASELMSSNALEKFKSSQMPVLQTFAQLPDFAATLKEKTGIASAEEFFSLPPKLFYVAANMLLKPTNTSVTLNSVRILGSVSDANNTYVVFELSGVSSGEEGKIVQMLPVVNENGKYYVMPIP